MVNIGEVVVGVIIGTAMVYDLYFMKIPNYITMMGYMAVIPICYMEGGMQQVVAAFINLCIVGYISYILYLFGAVGAGDVKLMGVISMYNAHLKDNVKYMILVLFISAFIGVLKLITSGLKSHTIKFTIPMMMGYLGMLISKGGC